jgi:DNA-binding NarL/FixJ family response regulator
MRILMVENHAVFARTVIEQFLASHEVRVVTTIAAARNALAVTQYDALLVDYDLDDGKGDVLIRSLVETHPPFLGRVIAISAHPEGNTALTSAGAHAVCPKTKFHTIAHVLTR